MLPSQTSISPLDIASGTANSFFQLSGGAGPGPTPSAGDIQVSSISFGDTTGGFPTSGTTLYKGNAAVAGGTSSTIISVYQGSVGNGNLYLNDLGLLQNSNTVGTNITEGSAVFNINGGITCTAPGGILTVSSINTSTVNGAPYVPQPITRFGQGVIGGAGNTVVNIPQYPTTAYSIILSGCPSTVVLGKTVSTFTAGGPVGSNFSWFTVQQTQ